MRLYFPNCGRSLEERLREFLGLGRQAHVARQMGLRHLGLDPRGNHHAPSQITNTISWLEVFYR